MTRILGGILFAGALATTGCGADAVAVDASQPSRPDAARTARLDPEGPVVATVDGEPITLAEVQATVDATGLAPIEALHRLEEERVLHRLAERAGLDTVDVERGARRAAVQALLRERVEDEVTESSVTEAELMAHYDAARASFVQPERRTSAHVLARLEPDADEAALAAAERFVRRVIDEVGAEVDPAAAIDRYREEDSEGRVFRVVVEHLPAAPRTASLEAAYVEALFSRDTPGVVDHPVRTSYGFHAIVVASIEPSFRVSLAEAEPMLRRQILAEHRGARLDALDRELRAHTPVTLDQAVLSRAMTAELFADEPVLGASSP